MSFDGIWCALADGEPAFDAFRICTEFTSGFCFCLSSLWYWAAVRWVDKRATWFKGFPLRADILVFVEDLVARKRAARSLRLRGLALLLHFESPFCRVPVLWTRPKTPQNYSNILATVHWANRYG